MPALLQRAIRFAGGVPLVAGDLEGAHASAVEAARQRAGWDG